MSDCPLADECPSFTERIAGMGCQHYGDRGGKEWCNHYTQPIDELKSEPVKIGEELIVEVTDVHESGAGVGRTDDGFIVMVDGVLPHCRASVEISAVRSNHARADLLERLPLDPDGSDESDESDEPEESTESDGEEDEEEKPTSAAAARRERLGSRENFWGG